jgi:large conductance mechanosensitive channel
MKKLLKEFRDFAIQGDAMSMAVGIMIGGAFSKIVSSVVNDLFMPIIGRITGGVDFSDLFIALDGNRYTTLAQATEAGAPTFAYGNFITTVIDFILLALCVFLFVKGINALKAKTMKPASAAPAPKPRLCPYCFGEVHEGATRCPHCTSVLEKQ